MNMLRTILQEKGLTTKQASEMTSIPFETMQTLTYRQNNFMEIKVDTLVKLCSGLGIRAYDLFVGEEQELVRKINRKGRKKRK